MKLFKGWTGESIGIIFGYDGSYMNDIFRTKSQLIYQNWASKLIGAEYGPKKH